MDFKTEVRTSRYNNGEVRRYQIPKTIHINRLVETDRSR
jgi:hypothetical protein